MRIEILEDNRILVNKNGVNYLLEKELISGTCIYNYFIYQDIYSDLNYLLDKDNEDRYWYGDSSDLFEALKSIQENGD